MSRIKISARDSDGRLVWFYADNSTYWNPSCLLDGPLFLKGEQWILMASDLESYLQPEGKVVQVEIALAWLIRNGYELPEQVQDFAEEYRI